jgi:N6-L-threonylcarbamoyladenine synthase
MTILGIETSCDETSASVVVDGQVRSNIISSQLVHSSFGGVVPELASRAHIRLIIQIVEQALAGASVSKRDINGVAATYGPGLAGALLVGLSFGKAVAYGLNVPFIGVNHLEGHLYSNFLDVNPPVYPFICLVVSGGHTILALVEEPFRHSVLGQTRDDASGEAFDKVAKMLGLPYPGGPVIDRLAGRGNPAAISFPRSYLEEGSYDFSFSGLKTSVLYYLRDNGLLSIGMEKESIDSQRLSDICASFQEAVVDVLVAKTIDAAMRHDVRTITMAGGVSANSRLRKRLDEAAGKIGLRLCYPRAEYCMDNAAMIGYVGWMKLGSGVTSGLDLNVAPNLTL